MIFFYVLKDTQVYPRSSGQAIRFKAPRSSSGASQRIPAENIYFTTQAQFVRMARSIADVESVVRVLDDQAAEVILGSGNFPKEITFFREGDVADIFTAHGDSIAVAMINGMGNGIGDSIVGLRALEIFYKRIQENYSRVAITVLRRINPQLDHFYRHSKAVHQALDMPRTLDMLLACDYFMSLEAFALSREFNSMPMIDYFLSKLGMDPSSVAAGEKHGASAMLGNCIKNPDKSLHNILQQHKEKGCKLLLVHPVASDAIRSMPPEFISQLVDYLLVNTDYIVTSAVGLGCLHERYLDVSRYSQNIDDFVYIVANMDAVISVDTSTYHIADTFDVPAVVLFNTIDPQYRISYYPCTRGIWLGEGQDTLVMRHTGFTQQDKTILDTIYRNFDYEKLLFELDRAVSSARSIRR